MSFRGRMVFQMKKHSQNTNEMLPYIDDFQTKFLLYTVKRKKNRRRSKSAVPLSTNADVHAGEGSDSEAFSAAEKGYDNKGYLSTEASATETGRGGDGGGEKQIAAGQTSTEEAIADILDDTGIYFFAG